jgi:mRNA-degrading endonuclease RelE of RelBE toxin-antitoxin system
VVRYKILMKATAAREYEALADKADRRRILAKIGRLTDDPRPGESRCLPESENYRRICVVRYRVIYRIDDFNKQVTVFRIAQRRRHNSAR